MKTTHFKSKEAQKNLKSQRKPKMMTWHLWWCVFHMVLGFFFHNWIASKFLDRFVGFPLLYRCSNDGVSYGLASTLDRSSVLHEVPSFMKWSWRIHSRRGRTTFVSVVPGTSIFLISCAKKKYFIFI